MLIPPLCVLSYIISFIRSADTSWGPCSVRQCTTRCEGYPSEDHLPSDTPSKLTDKRRRVNSPCHCKSTDLSPAPTSFPLSPPNLHCKRIYFSAIHFNSLCSIQPPFPNYSQQKDSVQAVRINPLLFHSLPLGLSLTVHTPCSRTLTLHSEEWQLFPQSLHHHPPLLSPGRTQHWHHPPPLFRLDCGNFLAARRLWARAVGIFMIISGSQDPQKSLLLLQAVYLWITDLGLFAWLKWPLYVVENSLDFSGFILLRSLYLSGDLGMYL